jgi:hypothetical protein
MVALRVGRFRKKTPDDDMWATTDHATDASEISAENELSNDRGKRWRKKVQEQKPASWCSR